MEKFPFDVNDSALRASFLGPSLFDVLATLEERTRARWGRMSAQQMVEHLSWAFELSTGRAEVKCPIPEAELARRKAFLYGNMPTPHEFVNPVLAAGLPALRHAALSEAKTALRLEVERFQEQAAAGAVRLRTHPVFGALGTEEWERSHFKHVYHHLLQLGLIETA